LFISGIECEHHDAAKLVALLRLRTASLDVLLETSAESGDAN